MSSRERSVAKASCNAQHVPSEDVISARQVWGVIRVGTRDPSVGLVHVTDLPTAFRRPSLGLPSLTSLENTVLSPWCTLVRPAMPTILAYQPRPMVHLLSQLI